MQSYRLKQMFFLFFLCTLTISCGPNDYKSFGIKKFGISNFYAGFDTSSYPGDSVMQDIWSNTNMYFVGFYLAPAPHRRNASWMNKYDVLKNMGWGLVPFYFGKQQIEARAGNGSVIYPSDLPNMNWSTGEEDAQQAVDDMRIANFPSGSVIYLDVESSFIPDNQMLDYYKGWVQKVIDEGFVPGVYCSYLRVANALRNADSRPLFWIVQHNSSRCRNYTNQFPGWDPTGSGVDYAIGWQLVIDCSTELAGHTLNVDLDSSNMRDPSIFSSLPTPSLPPAIPNLVAPVSPNFPSAVTSVNGNPITIEWVDQTNASFYKLLFFVWNTMGYWDSYGPFNLMTSSPSYVGGIQNDRYAAWMLQACNTVSCSNWSSPGYFYYIGP